MLEDLENKEIKLLDEMLGGKLSRDIYEKTEKKYNDKRREAGARLSQLEVDYDDPLDFLDKCIVIGSMLSFLHQKFNFEQRKNLLKAIFEKIYVLEEIFFRS
jgi:benzoyl-CoA reductase/2-hydroxyglutaryl-CoA dehydratase subunit BcrC/BadD/HgdB